MKCASWWIIIAGLVCFLSIASRSRAAGAQKEEHSHAAHFDACAKACADCMRSCESCAHHCAQMIADGKKEHMTTLGTCVDCAEICATAAKIVSHQGPMVFTICEACAKACDDCAVACEKFPTDDHMKECAKACRDCAKACKEMLRERKP
jgi:Domain of Unknown Function (DUF326)